MIRYSPILTIYLFITHVHGGQNESCDPSNIYDSFGVVTPMKTVMRHGDSIKIKCKHTEESTTALCQYGQIIIKNSICHDNKFNESYVETTSITPVKREKRFVFFLIICAIFRCEFLYQRDRIRPEIINCPSSRTVVATPIQNHAPVYWTPPTAWDNQDGDINVHMNRYYRPGSVFSETNPTKIGYYARDSSGNMETCNFDINIIVKRCSTRRGTISNGYRLCHPSTDMVYGTICWYGCYQGFVLKGAPSRIQCQRSGEWTSRNEPHCERIQCPSIVPRSRQRVSCTDRYYFRSICTFECDEGYDIPDGVRRTKVCLASGYWNGDDPTCVDILPPMFQQCPSTLMFFPEDNMDIANITWEEPEVIDNKDEGLKPQQIEGPAPHTYQEVNSYSVTYIAQDLTGNKAKDCSFNVVVKQLRCPKLYPLPYMRLNCTGTRRGSQCLFSCDDNSKLVGPLTTMCQRQGDLPYSAWNMETPPICEIGNGCPVLIPPLNGALACDVWLGGRFCHPLCQEGFSVVKKLPNILVCQDNGKWTRRKRLKDCLRITSSEKRRMTMKTEFYFTGNCSDPETKMEIRAKFIHTIKSSKAFRIKKLCESPKCNIGNVQVICGKTTKRSTSNTKIYIEIIMQSTNETLTSEQYEEESFIVTEFVHSFNDEMTSGNLSLVIGDEEALYQEMSFTDLQLDCPENHVPSFDKSVACVKCPPGTFYDIRLKTCEQCSRGTYQPNPAESSCIACPYHQTTGRIGAINITECEDACEPGTWSTTALPPCFDCDIGFYEDQYGSIGCSICPGNKITERESSTNITDCKDYDIVFLNASSGSYSELQLFEVEMSAQFVVSFRISCDPNCEGSFFLMKTSNLKIELTTRQLSVNLNAYDVFEDFDLSQKWYYIRIDFEMGNISVFIDDRLHYTFPKTMNLQNVTQNFNITLGGDGFIGTISQFNVVRKDIYDTYNHEYSACKSDEVPRSIVNWNEFAYSSLVNSYISVPFNCDDDDGCISDPCAHGYCKDMLGGYRCTCEIGYKGKNCDVNIDDCIAHACQNNATCVDQVNGYSCNCEYEFTGELCEIAMVHGQWSKWDNWTDCSVSCGNGTMRRRRSCSDPAPDNGGKNCNGSDTEIKECVMEQCRVCSDLQQPENSTLTCTNTSDMIVCTHECNDGYYFDHDVKDEYVCGNETYYYWDFQTKDNPNGRLPQCSEIEESTSINIDHSAFYDLEECVDHAKEEVKDLISTKITLLISHLTCISSELCVLSNYRVLNCVQRRPKRDTSATSNVGFAFKLSCNTTAYGIETCFYRLDGAIKEFEAMENNDTLDFLHRNNVYHMIKNASVSVGTLECPEGAISVKAYCVPCSIGRYYSKEECIPCPIGTYQDKTGQLSCVNCPEGLSTAGTNSISIEDCNFRIPVPESFAERNIIISVCVCFPLFVFAVALIVHKSKNQFCRQYQMMNAAMEKEQEITKCDNDEGNTNVIGLTFKTLVAENSYHNKTFDRHGLDTGVN